MKLTGINQLWVADITYIRLRREFVFLAVILDAFSRRVVGWQLDHTLAVRLPLTALEQAIAERKPGPGLVHHSDRGLQYASAEHVNVLRQHQMLPSMSRPANPYDKDYVSHCTSFVLSGMSLTSDTLRENFMPWAFFGASLPGGSYR